MCGQTSVAKRIGRWTLGDGMPLPVDGKTLERVESEKTFCQKRTGRGTLSRQIGMVTLSS